MELSLPPSQSAQNGEALRVEAEAESAYHIPQGIDSTVELEGVVAAFKFQLKCTIM